MSSSILCVAVISLAVGCVLGWVCGVYVASGRQTQMRSDVRELLRDVHTLKADAAKVRIRAADNALEQRRILKVAEMARNEAAKAVRTARTLRPALRLIRAHNRELLS
jgi:hypothetical protein